MGIYTGWWCNFTNLKNDGVRKNGVGMTSLYEMEHITFHGLNPPSSV